MTRAALAALALATGSAQTRPSPPTAGHALKAQRWHRPRVDYRVCSPKHALPHQAAHAGSMVCGTRQDSTGPRAPATRRNFSYPWTDNCEAPVEAFAAVSLGIGHQGGKTCALLPA